VLKVQGGDVERGNVDRLNIREQRALTGMVILGFIGFLLYGQNGGIIGAVAGALIGYFWK
jgi:hypothetical protein